MQSRRTYRHSFITRITHWLWALAIFFLVMSGLEIFNAAPFLDASDKTNPAKRVLAIGADGTDAAPRGVTTVFGHEFSTTGVLGFTDDGAGGEEPRAFPGWATFPATRDLADGRGWHFVFGWILSLALVTYIVAAARRGDLRNLILAPSDLPKLWPMQLYYLRLRKTPPPYGAYNPLQKATYTGLVFVLLPLVILSGLALSPGFDALAQPLTWLFGGRQFARLWHFTFMGLLIAFFCIHTIMVLSTGAWNNIRSMITGWYTRKERPEITA